MNWQYKFFDDILDLSRNSDSVFIDAINNSQLLESKTKALPDSLLKFYGPTPNNILDILNQRLWLSDPTSFNDPFDCTLTYNRDEYQKHTIIEYIRKDKDNLINSTASFTSSDLKKLNNTYIDKPISHKQPFHSTLNKILEQKNEQFRSKIEKLLNDRSSFSGEYIREINKGNTRVACFSAYNPNDCNYGTMLLWSHYTDSHKGFCVKYDLSALKNCNSFEVEYYKYEERKKYNSERMLAAIKMGLFSVIYTRKRVSLPHKLIEKQFKNKTSLIDKQKIEKLKLKSLITKSSAWNYEKEWRLIIDNQIAEYYDNKIPFPFAKAIYVGCKASSDLIRSLSDIAKQLNLEIHIMQEGSQDFDLYPCDINWYNQKRKSKAQISPFLLE